MHNILLYVAVTALHSDLSAIGESTASEKAASWTLLFDHLLKDNLGSTTRRTRLSSETPVDFPAANVARPFGRKHNL